MHALGIFTGADLKRFSEVELQTEFGQSGRYYYNVARGIDERPVKAHLKRKSISNETTFESNITDKALIWQTLTRLAERVEMVLESKQLVARTLTLKLRYADFQTNTRGKTDPTLYASKDDMLGVLPELLRKTEVGKRPIRLIGITLSNLEKLHESASDSPTTNLVENPQLGLF